ncbi:MAG: hypothetical protein P8J55_11740 [Pseudomonadales bacterium]|nr:hypothetical protein [Pseudomonadales bacterium]
MPEGLPQGYYDRNFTYLLEFVAERYHAILNAEELSFLDDFQHLSLPAQRLYVRLYSRKGPLFRTDKLSYEDIPDITEAAQETVDFIGKCHEIPLASINPRPSATIPMALHRHC